MRLDREEKKYKDIRLASIFGIVGNIFLLIIKAIVGFITNSQAMIADSVNSAGDILSSVMTYVGNRIASKPGDDDHNLGHGKAEYIYSMLISIAMLLLGYEVIKSSIMSLVNHNKVEFSIWLVVVCITTLIVKSSLFIYTNYLCKKYDNLLLIANSKDHLNDCMITSLNLVACLLSLFEIYF